MPFLDWLGAWPNVPFTIALAATALFAVVQASGLLGILGGGDAHDGHAGGDAGDGHAGGDVGGDADAGDAHVGDAQAVDASHASIGAALLSPLGVGRVPITLTAQVGGVAFAVTGLALNTPWLADAAALPLTTLAWTLPGGALVAYASAALVARALAPIVDDRLHAATSRRELIGAIGTVISSRVTEEFGEIRVRDRSGHDVRVVCRLAAASRAMSERDEAVIVEVDDRGVVFVAPLDAVATRVEASASEDPAEDRVATENARQAR